MKPLALARLAVVACAGAVALASCGGASQSAAPPAGIAPQNTGGGVAPLGKTRSIPVPAARPPAQQRPDRHKSWVSPDVKGMPRLLFVSDYGADVVDIFSMPAMKLKGTLTGFTYPEGMCTDASGNVWIANAGASEMMQYSRTGSLLNTISIPNEFPAACAVYKANNTLAVLNIESTSGPGNLMVFKNASGTPTTYSDPDIYQYFFGGFDMKGNLFFDGTDQYRSTSYLAELPNGSSTPMTISLSGGTLTLPGFVQWYKTGNYLALGDQECGGTTSSCIYWVDVSGSSGTITATTPLTNYAGGNVCDLVQGVIAANGEKYVAGPDYESCGYTTSAAYRWPYEAGGSPTNYNDTAGLVEPIGAAVTGK